MGYRASIRHMKTRFPVRQIKGWQGHLGVPGPHAFWSRPQSLFYCIDGSGSQAFNGTTRLEQSGLCPGKVPRRLRAVGGLVWTLSTAF